MVGWKCRWLIKIYWNLVKIYVFFIYMYVWIEELMDGGTEGWMERGIKRKVKEWIFRKNNK